MNGAIPLDHLPRPGVAISAERWTEILAAEAERDATRRALDPSGAMTSLTLPELAVLALMDSRDRVRHATETENTRLREALTTIAKRDDWTSGECRNHAKVALT